MPPNRVFKSKLSQTPYILVWHTLKIHLSAPLCDSLWTKKTAVALHRENIRHYILASAGIQSYDA